MINEPFIFIAGHHRSGTSLIHEILRSHPSISGFSNTGVYKDEGQHLQSVIKPAWAYGGAGKYIFDKDSHMDESHPLATADSANTLWKQWSQHYDKRGAYYIEKSPPNLVRTRFLQALFPNSKFIVVFRHPIAVAYATKKWSKTPIRSLVEHTLLGYEIFSRDKRYLKDVYVVRYEDFVLETKVELDKICAFLGLVPIPVNCDVRPDINSAYFKKWEKDKRNPFKRKGLPKVDEELENRAQKFGYSFKISQ